MSVVSAPDPYDITVRSSGLRRRKVIPPGLVEGLGQMAGRPGGLDPRQAYQLCQQYPSAAASVRCRPSIRITSGGRAA